MLQYANGLPRKNVRTMDIQYSLIRSRKRKKTISLQIGRNSEITVYAPYTTSDRDIQRFIEEKRKWIDRSIRKQVAMPAQAEKKSFVTGEPFYYLGQSYPLEAFFEPLETAGVVFWNNRFFLNCPDKPDMRRHCFIRWYKEKARQYISERVDFYSGALKLAHRGVRISSAAGRWGSCSHDNRLSFSYRLIMASPRAVDYVVVHELAHIREKNHSSKFWNLVIEVMPDCRTQRRWLRDHQSVFNL